MSWQATSWASGLEYSTCGPLAFRVLIKIANVADDEGRSAYRAKKIMADELGVSQRSIQRALKELEHARLLILGDQRILAHIRKDRRPTVYDLNMSPKIALQIEVFDGETKTPDNGETELSTGSHGETTVVHDGETTVVHKNDLLNKSINSSRDNHTGPPCPSNPNVGHSIGIDHRCKRCGLFADQYLRHGEVFTVEQVNA